MGWVLATLCVVAAVWPSQAVAAAYPNDPEYSRQWGLRRIGAPEAWKTTKGAGIVVADIDTGVDRRHPDLGPKLVPGYDTLEHDTDPIDPQGHGTATSGVIAAVTNNGQGIAGDGASGEDHAHPGM